MPADTAARPATARVFFALWPAPELAARLAAVARERAGRGRPTRAETVHLTLAFIGDVPESRLPELVEAAGRVRAAPCALQIDRLGHWRHNRLLWAGCSAPPPALAELVAGLLRELRAAGFAVADAERAFVPHLTLVRKLALPPPDLGLPETLFWECRDFVLVRSRLSAAGPDYQRLARFPLSA